MDIEQTLKGLGLSERTIEAFLESPECIKGFESLANEKDEISIDELIKMVEDKCSAFDIARNSIIILLDDDAETVYDNKAKEVLTVLNFLMTDVYGYRDGHDKIYDDLGKKIKNYDWSKLDEQRN